MQRIALEEMRRLQKEIDDEDQRFERTAAELKGKSYTYDREGNVVVIKPMSKRRSIDRFYHTLRFEVVPRT